MGQEKPTGQPNVIRDIAETLRVNAISVLPHMSPLGMKDIFQEASDRLINMRGMFNLGRAEEINVIIGCFRATGTSVVVPAAELVADEYPLTQGWEDIDRAFLLDSALAVEIALSEEQANRLIRKGIYYGFDEHGNNDRELQHHEANTYSLKQYQQRIQRELRRITSTG